MSSASPKGSYQVTRPNRDDTGGPGRRQHEHTSQLDIDWVKTIAGALAAVSSAVLLSTLGAAGTLVGAALGSVVVTVGGALYSQGLARSRGRLARVPIPARSRGVSSARDEARPDETRKTLPAAAADEPTRPTPWRERLAVLPWRRVGLGAAALFVVTILAITGFELVAGRSLSSIVGGGDGGGGTTITRLDGSDRDTSRDDDQAPSEEEVTPSEPPLSESPEATDVPPESPSAETTTVPTTDPTTTPSADATALTPTPTPTPTPAPTPTSPPASTATP